MRCYVVHQQRMKVCITVNNHNFDVHVRIGSPALARRAATHATESDVNSLVGVHIVVADREFWLGPLSVLPRFRIV